MPSTHKNSLVQKASPVAAVLLSVMAMAIAAWAIERSDRMTAQGAAIYGFCKDMDGGLNPFIASKVVTDYSEFPDYCFSATQLAEYVCKNQGYPGTNLITCEYGCWQAACLTVARSCSDSDGGDVPGVLGTAVINPTQEQTQTDSCANDMSVTEFSCNGATIVSNARSCTYGCENGRCKTQQESLAVCGNGTKASFEGCDDGNKTNGDGCNDVCGIEGGWACIVNDVPRSVCSVVQGDGIIIAGKETCDDGNTTQNDGCFNGAVEQNFLCEGAPSVCKRTGVNGVPYSCKAFDAAAKYVSGSYENSAAACWTKWANSGQLAPGWTVFYNNQPIDASVIVSSSSSSKSSSSQPASSAAPLQASSSKTSTPAVVQSSSKTSAAAQQVSSATVIVIPVAASSAVQSAQTVSSGQTQQPASSQPGVQSQTEETRGSAPVKTFLDIPQGSTYYTAVTALASKGIINGNPDGTFRPYDLVNRAETAKILMLALGVEIGNLQNLGRFWDVPEGEWYVPFVMRAEQRGVLSGYPDGSFGPVNNINRVEFLKMISLTFGTDLNIPFSYDDVTGSEWFAQYVGLAYRYSLFGTDSELRPAKAVTRGEIANAIYVILSIHQ